MTVISGRDVVFAGAVSEGAAVSGIEVSHIEAAALINTRVRVVWTMDEKKHLDRVARDFNAHGDKFLMRCGNPVCPDDRIIMHVDQSVPTGAVLRCGCTDRVFSPTC